MSVCLALSVADKHSRGDPRPSINTRTEKHLISLPRTRFCPAVHPVTASSPASVQGPSSTPLSRCPAPFVTPLAGPDSTQEGRDTDGQTGAERGLERNSCALCPWREVDGGWRRQLILPLLIDKPPKRNPALCFPSASKDRDSVTTASFCALPFLYVTPSNASFPSPSDIKEAVVECGERRGSDNEMSGGAAFTI